MSYVFGKIDKSSTIIENNIVKKIQAEKDTATCEISAAQNFLKLI